MTGDEWYSLPYETANTAPVPLNMPVPVPTSLSGAVCLSDAPATGNNGTKVEVTVAEEIHAPLFPCFLKLAE